MPKVSPVKRKLLCAGIAAALFPLPQMMAVKYVVRLGRIC